LSLYKYISVSWIAVFSSACKLFTNNWRPCVLVYMISSDATIHFKFITAIMVELLVMPICTWDHMQGYVRQKMNNIVDSVVDWLFQLHCSTKPFFQVGAIKFWKLVAWEGPTTNVFQRITVEFYNCKTFPPRKICNIRY